MYTVVELERFTSSAKKANIHKEDLQSIIEVLAKNPYAGEVMLVTWGTRKYRHKARRAGKSRRYRIVTFCAGKHMPVFLLDVFAEGEKLNYSEIEKIRVKEVLTRVTKAYKRGPS